MQTPLQGWGCQVLRSLYCLLFCIDCGQFLRSTGWFFLLVPECHFCALRFKLNWFSPDYWYYRSRGTSLVWSPTHKNDFKEPVKKNHPVSFAPSRNLHRRLWLVFYPKGFRAKSGQWEGQLDVVLMCETFTDSWTSPSVKVFAFFIKRLHFGKNSFTQMSFF